jgi:hypothetical protein
MSLFDKIEPSTGPQGRPDSIGHHHVEAHAVVLRSSTRAPQLAHTICGYPVDEKAVVAGRQGVAGGFGVCVPGFLPTMKPQLSQLPLIVGSGRVSS